MKRNELYDVNNEQKYFALADIAEQNVCNSYLESSMNCLHSYFSNNFVSFDFKVILGMNTCMLISPILAFNCSLKKIYYYFPYSRSIREATGNVLSNYRQQKKLYKLHNVLYII